MKILHTVTSIDLSQGGPSKSVSDLATELAKKGEKVTISTKASSNQYLKISPHPNLQLNFTFNNSIKHKTYDLFHGHGIWQISVHSLAKMARKINIPYIITPRGMLEPWAMDARKWKKKLAMTLYQKKDLDNAACIHATAQMEANNIRKLGFKNPIAVIPNGIDLKEFPLPENKPLKKKNTILFLSRIHPKKGIELLIEAWLKIDKTLRQNWQIEITGNGEKYYINSLQKLINHKDLGNEICIIGPQFGKAKLDAYQRADLFVLPTFSENFGIVVAEALACGVPVITTKGTPWEELNTNNAGWWIDIGTKPLVETLQKAIQTTDEQRTQMGLNGRKLIEQNYSIDSVAKKMIQLYEWILNKGEKPDFVYAD